ncbi:MAG: hypothetical protein ACRDT6_19920, partial [Micromonosporaceae bacterium]
HLVAAGLIVAVLAAGAGYAVWRAGHAAPPAPRGLDLTRTGTVVTIDPTGRYVRQLTRDGRQLGTGPRCQRSYAAAGTMACLRALGPQFSAQLTVYDARLRERLTLPIWGNPSRVRVSADGRLVAWTVFRSGDSYLAAGGFSTTAGIYDLRTAAHYGSLEDFTAYVGGKPYQRLDINYWGVTFASDDRTFYATMASDGRTWLVRGDLEKRTLTAIRGNVECPSLSPDGTRIAYKKREGDRWRLHVLTLRTSADVALAETAHVDDQPAWLDGATVAYARPDPAGPAVYAVPADGTGTPRRLFAGSSPAALG